MRVLNPASRAERTIASTAADDVSAVRTTHRARTSDPEGVIGAVNSGSARLTRSTVLAPAATMKRRRSIDIGKGSESESTIDVYTLYIPMRVLGIDAGGTKTLALLANDRGEILSEARGAGVNLQSAGELAVEKVLHET